MKNFIHGLFCFILIFSAISCKEQLENKVEKTVLIPKMENGKIVGYTNLSNIRLATEAEIQIMIKAGWLSELGSRSNTCEWHDGEGGSINCDGGHCKAILVNGKKALGCYVNGNLDHWGAERP